MVQRLLHEQSHCYFTEEQSLFQTTCVINIGPKELHMSWGYKSKHLGPLAHWSGLMGGGVQQLLKEIGRAHV